MSNDEVQDKVRALISDMASDVQKLSEKERFFLMARMIAERLVELEKSGINPTKESHPFELKMLILVVTMARAQGYMDDETFNKILGDFTGEKDLSNILFN